MRFRHALGIACLPLLASLACQGTAPAPKAPETRSGQDATTFFQTEVKDPYRWLEDGSSAEVKDWIRAQNEHAESVLGSFPDGKEIAERVRQLATTSPVRSAARMSGGVLFFLRETPPQPTPVLVAQKWPGGEERTIVDVNSEGGHQVITDYWPSPSGGRVAYGTAEGGSELTTIHFLDVETAKPFADPLPYAGGGTSPPALAWDPDEGGVIYMRFPIPAAGQPMSQFDAALFHHSFDPSTPDADALGKDYSHIAEYRLLTSADGKQMAALAKKGDGGPWDVFLRTGDGWNHALDGSAGVTTASYAGDRLLVVATAGTPNGRILALTPDGKQSELLAEGDESIESVAPIGDGFLVVHCWGPDWRVDQYDPTGAVVRQVPLPKEGIQIAQIASQAGADTALIAYSGWTTPGTWVSYDGRTGKTETVFEVKPAADYSKVRMDRIEAKSKDGTTLPVVVLSLNRNEGSGPAPAILT
ncbi:MAG TPA: hypothetical protein VNI57_07550, partial [Candidatus Saccharimonadales bacterium]|nr:hypothetical protein [Candidatus Saccharimonadales bacterium]